MPRAVSPLLRPHARGWFAALSGTGAFLLAGALGGVEDAVVASVLMASLARHLSLGGLDAALAMSISYGVLQNLAYYGVRALGLQSYLENEGAPKAVTIGLTAYLTYWVVLLAWTRSIRVHSKVALAPASTRRIRGSRVLRAYVLMMLVEVLAGGLLGYQALGQVFNAASQSRMLLLMAMPVLAKTISSRPRLLTAALVGAEMLLGLGYFAEFKTPLFVILTGLVMTSVKLPVLRSVAVVLIAVLAGVFWTSIKPDVRQEMGASVGQENRLSRFETVRVVAEQVSEVGAPQLEEAAETLVQRISYVDMFGLVLLRFPGREPYLGGDLILASLGNVFMPRILFKDKRVFHDSELTRRIATVDVAGAESSTSISVGWVGEAYADLGYFGVVVSILLLALIACGSLWLIRAFVGPGPLWVYCAALFLLRTMPQMEDSLLKKPASMVLSMVGLTLGAMVLSRWLIIPRGAVQVDGCLGENPCR